MTEFLADNIEAFEALYIHPTMHVDSSTTTFERAVMDLELQKARFAEFVFDDEAVSKSPQVHDFFSHTFSSSYSSEEEDASRGSADSLSLHSNDGDFIIATPLVEPNAAFDKLALKPEQLASSCVKIEHRCNRAQAITLKTAGKPKIVSLAKVVEVSPLKSRASADSKRPSVSSLRPGSRKSVRPSFEALRVSKVVEEDVPSEHSIVSLSATGKSSEASSSLKSESSSLAPLRKPSVPLLRAAAAFDPYSRFGGEPTLDSVPRRKTLIKRAHTASTSVPVTSAEVDCSANLPQLSYESPTKRRLHRIASSLSLSHASDLIRRKSSLASLRAPASAKNSSALRPNHLPAQETVTPALPIPTRRSSMGKLTPRGPTERAPIIVLPPCPDDEDEDDDFMSVTPVEALQKWDRSRARHVRKANKARPSIDDIVARLL